MSIPVLKVLQPGLYSTIQDLGRLKFRSYGVTTSGAMDDFALRVGNRLVGNNQDEAGIELTFRGGEYLFMKDSVISVTGADLNPKVDGQDIPIWESLLIRKGSRLFFGNPSKGIRAYITIQGGINIPIILNSKSTDMKVGFGGLEGRRLKTGDMLCQNEERLDTDVVGSYFSGTVIDDYYGWDLQTKMIRVLLGPDLDHFTKEGIETFLKSKYSISVKSDRKGYNLEGPKIAHSQKGPDITTNTTTVGAVQVPGQGTPIILLRDCQTVGGYAKIATVITPDIAVLANSAPGQQVSFCKVDIERAYLLYRNREKLINSEVALKRDKSIGIYHVKIEDKSYLVSVRKT